MSDVAPTSRYVSVQRAKLELPDGRTLVYLRRRFLPAAADLTQMDTHVVAEGERLDQIAAVYLGDPEQFWRICDANNAMQPEALTAEVGRVLRITLPEGVPGSPYAR